MGKAKKSTKKFLQKKGAGQQVFKKKQVAHRSRERAGKLKINTMQAHALRLRLKWILLFFFKSQSIPPSHF
jgi:hypothetical protein